MGEKTVSGTKEWATTTVNVMKGCSHKCLYCYGSANAYRFHQKEIGMWGEEEVNEKMLEKSFGKRKGTIMFPSTHDITLSNLQYTLPILRRLLEAGNNVLVVSKPDISVFQHITKELIFYKEQLLFRFTIGAFDNVTLETWEPGAPSFRSRLESLAWCFNTGYKTSVSMEPLLEVHEDRILGLVSILSPFVTDFIWIGKMNKVIERLRRNGVWESRSGIQEMAEQLIKYQQDENILSLYEKLKDHPKIKWKESIKKIVGIELPKETGLDI